MNETSEATGARVSRRGLFRGVAAGGIALGGGAVGAVAFGGSSPYKKRSLTIEVACLANLWREGPKSALAKDEGENRTPFLVEGWIYPAGTIKGDGFIPNEEGSIGRWFCRGWNITDPARPEPHTDSHQDFIFGKINKERLFPPDTLAAVGLEGSFEPSKPISTRAVIGGTGKYFGATGQVLEQFMGPNTSQWPGAPPGTPGGPNFRFDFDLRVLA